MEIADIVYIIKWWLMFFVLGLIFLPLTVRIFSNFFDKGYIFSKILGIVFISYVVFLLGILKILPFSEFTIVLIAVAFLILNILLISKYPSILISFKKPWKIFLFEEVLFLTTLFFWSYIRAHEPSIHGLEKYEDFGFVNSILRSEYFPPRDMWFTPLSINYYYFGHLVTAVLTKVSSIPSYITFNLMLATIFALTFTASFSIGANLIEKVKSQKSKVKSLLGGLLTGFLVTMGGSLHTIYTFFKPYVSENPVPFWQLVFSPNTFPNSYWYPNATRFIQNTIHEPPIYSAVVSDLHAHFLDMPFVLLTIAVLFLIISNVKFQMSNFKSAIGNWKLEIAIYLIFISFLLAVMYMANTWDSIIYFFLTALILLVLYMKQRQTSTMEIKNSFLIGNLKLKILSWLFSLFIIAVAFILFTLPFNLHFKPFASGIGILCAPQFLTNIGNIGPFLFEADHCQHSPWWQLLILYGFFYFWAISFIIMLFKINPFDKLRVDAERSRSIKNQKSKIKNASQKLKSLKNLNFIENFKLKIENLNPSDLFVLLLIVFSTFLIILPELIYAKDIYPGHYRANTMFKLGYQAFIMLSIASAYIIVRLITPPRWPNGLLGGGQWKFVYWVIGSIGLLLVSVYPYFAIKSYYGELKIYHGLDGLQYLKRLYPTDYEAILWINENIQGQPVILEAQGDSYTDYGRVSTNTGLPTVLGWPVHEWLWRGSYDIPSPRIPEVQAMYESKNLEETKNLLKKHNVSLVFFGDLERQKYPNLNEDKFKRFGKVIYENGKTKIYETLF